jgi:Ser/Thr protein kinase RdoA (MazF antagonist)
LLKLKNLFPNIELATLAVNEWQHTDLEYFKYWRISSNAIYPFKSNDSVHFLRLAPSDEKDATQIRAELEFLNYLKGKKYPVIEPVISKNGTQLEVADTPWGIFYATTFKEVPGKSLEDQNLDEQKIYKWGKSLGQLHTHSQQFKPTEAKRMDCLDVLNWVERVLTVFSEQEKAQDEVKILKAYFSQLEKTEHNYGLIHYDFELDNVFYNEETDEMAPIDFDDAMYHWYGMDIEQALESMRDCEEIENFDDARTAFIEGYRSERPLTDDAFKTAKMFRRFANLYGYTRVLRSVEEQLEEEPEWMLTLRSHLAQLLEKRSTFFGHDIDETLGGN